MPPDLALLSTLIGSNYPCLELIFMVPKVFEPLKSDCIYENMIFVGSHMNCLEEVVQMRSHNKFSMRNQNKYP